jgi:hypothetical protein
MLDQPKGHAGPPRRTPITGSAFVAAVLRAATVVSASALRIGFATARHVDGERVSFYTSANLTKMMWAMRGHPKHRDDADDDCANDEFDQTVAAQLVQGILGA